MLDDKKKGAGKLTEKKDAKPEKSESGGPKGPDPTRYGDWEIGGKCVDF